MRQIREALVLGVQLRRVVLSDGEKASLCFRFCGNFAPPKPILLRFSHPIRGRLRALRFASYPQPVFYRIVIHDSLRNPMSAMVIAADLNHAGAAGKSEFWFAGDHSPPPRFGNISAGTSNECLHRQVS